MVDKFYAETHLMGISSKVGQSQPIKIIADNGKKYFLKTQLVDGRVQNCVFFQELLCSLIARQLDVPVPNFAIIEIEKAFIEENPSLRFSKKFKEGLYFATEEIANVEDNLVDNINLAIQKGKPRIKKAWNSYFKNVKNKDAYAKIIIFDLYIQNFDRFTNDGNLLVGSNDNGERCVFAIDHGHAFFGPEYNTQKISYLRGNQHENYSDGILNMLKNIGGGFTLGNVFQGMQDNVDLVDVNPFKEIVHSIEKLTDEDLIQILKQIPNDWLVDGYAQMNEYLNFLSRQKNHIRLIITKMVSANLFTHCVGGELDWIELESDDLSGIQ